MEGGASDMSDAAAFIDRWAKSGGAERANYQLFLSELAALIDAAKPEPAQPGEAANNYVFDKAVTFKHVDGSTSTGFIDLYKRGCFVCEAKQSVKEGKSGKADPARIALFGGEDAGRSKAGTAKVGTAGWDLAMERARRQAEGYAKALPKEHGWPPFLVIADVGHCIELFADFSGQGKNYAQFPDRRSFRIMLADLANDDVRTRLKQVWTDPHALDPAKRSAEVTRDIAERLAIVAKELEKTHEPQAVALFLMRCLFTMFAEDVELLPKKCFHGMLERFKGRAGKLHNALTDLWQKMNTGGFSAGLEDNVRHFNGGLFRDASALPINEAMLGELIVAAGRDWRDVEPAIFGTLLERALSPKERTALGAQYTPRAYVERLVVPTIMEPLQEDWAAARVEAQQLIESSARRLSEADGLRAQPGFGKDKEKGDRDRRLREEARAELRAARKVIASFLGDLCSTRVLDPACGTGNFLYVAMELMKRLEGEVRDYLQRIGGQAELGFGAGETEGEVSANTVDPHNFLGIEKNVRAKEIAELVLWIGFLKWQLRTNSASAITDPVLRDFKTIQCKDAVLAWDNQELLLDEAGKPVTKWDGQTTKPHPVTGEQVPDETARIELYRYQNPRIQEWPEAEFIVGNPPFIAGQDLREQLGDGYALALWASRSRRKLPKAADFVMYWWDEAAAILLRPTSVLRRFGFITTNSITQSFNKRAVQEYLNQEHPLSLVFAIPDHPWPSGEGNAAVRIAMTVAERGGALGTLKRLASPAQAAEGPLAMIARRGKIHSDLSIGTNLDHLVHLKANEQICFDGFKLHGSGFLVKPEAVQMLRGDNAAAVASVLRPYRNGRDVTQSSRGLWVLDLYGLSEEEVREKFPAIYEYVLERVKPKRDVNPREYRRTNWWLWGENYPRLRNALAALPRYIVTVDTARHRVFSFLPAEVVCDDKLVLVCSDDAAVLATLSSRFHVLWSLRAAQTRLGQGNDPVYVKTRCFDPFPFPDLTPPSHTTLATLGEELDAFRKTRQAEHPSLTITDMYNVLEKLRRGDALTDDDKRIHEHGLISTLKRIHDQIDATVAAAYGLPANATDEAIMDHLVALNRTRAEEEKRGLVRWLRPAFQNPTGKAAAPTVTPELGLEIDETEQRSAFPEATGERARAVRAALITYARPATPEEIARTFRQGARIKKAVTEILETMAALGQAEQREGRYFAP